MDSIPKNESDFSLVQNPASELTRAHSTWRGVTIPARLIAIVLIVAVPLLLLTGFVTWRLAESQREASRSALIYAARTVAAAVEAELDRYRSLAETLARSPNLLSGDIEAFREEAQRFFPRDTGSWIVVANPEGQQLMNLVRPPGATLPKRGEAAIEAQTRAFETRRIQVSGVFRSALFNEPVATIEVPVFRDETPYVVIAVIMNLRRFYDLINTQSLPANWLNGILDQNGNFVARSKDNDRLVGTPASAGWRASIARNPVDGWDLFPSREGHLIYNVSIRVPTSEWVVGVATDKELIEAPIRAAMWRLVLGGLALTAMCCALAAWIARSIARPIGRIEQAATAIERGERVALPLSGIPELNKVERAFARAAEATLANAHLAAIVASTGDAVISYTPDGKIVSWNPAAERLFGYRQDEALGNNIAPMVPRELAAEAAEKRAMVRAGEKIRLETLRLRKDGVAVDVLITAAPIRAPDGTITGISAIAHDIGERKRHEEQIQFVMRELSHRTKNLLAVIQAVARQVGRQSVSIDDFMQRFGSRIHALAQAHDLLVNNQWLGAPVDQVVRAHLAGFSDRVELRGPALMLRPEAVQNLSLAIHELATNAVKYGSLSTPQGRVVVDWGADGEAAEYAFHWQESGGPIVVPPSRKGFGSAVLSYVVQGTTGGRASLDFHPEGVAWTLHLSRTNFVSPH